MSRIWFVDGPARAAGVPPMPPAEPSELLERLADWWRPGRHRRPRGAAPHPWLRLGARRHVRARG